MDGFSSILFSQILIKTHDFCYDKYKNKGKSMATQIYSISELESFRNAVQKDSTNLAKLRV